MFYTNEEMADMHLCYSAAYGVSLQAKRLYEEQFPNRRQPNHQTFAAIHRRLRETGRLKPLRVDCIFILILKIGLTMMAITIKVFGDKIHLLW